MFRIYSCITEQHDLRLVLVAGIVCLFACVSALNLSERARRFDGWPRLWWLAAAALVTGSGVWATHFVAMLAFRPGLPVGYDLGLTAMSVLLAVILSGVGLLVACQLRRPVLGGAIVGAAVGAMHYTGMAALLVPATKHWDALYAHSSLVLGVGLAAVALAVGLRGTGLRHRLAGAGLLALAICGLHFTAMAAFELRPDPRVPLPDTLFAPDLLAVAVVAVTLLIVSLGFAGSLLDQHLVQRSVQEAERLRNYVAELEATKTQLEQRTAEVTAALEEAAAGSQAKSQFLATMSHELRTPLNAIIGFAEMQFGEVYGPMGDPRYVEYARDIHTSGCHLLRVINDVLDLSKMDAGHLELREEPVDLSALISSTAQIVSQQALKAGVTLRTDGLPALPWLKADERRLRQVLLNLLSNAIKFTPEGGTVAVGAQITSDGVTLSVADTGIGMKEEHIPIALDRFGQIDNRLSRKYDGTGLGLPLSKRLVELHDGTMHIDSALGEGTTVYVLLPTYRVMEQASAA